MTTCRTGMAIAALLGVSLLGACGGSGSQETSDSGAAASAPAAEETVLANGMTPKEQIELRQGELKKMGKAFKTISDQLKAGEPDMAAIQAAAASVPEISADMDTWFPEGSGPESGEKTDALPVIWTDRTDFDEKLANFHTAAAALATTAEGGDLAAIKEAFGTTGGACKSCHEKFRADD